MIKAAELEEVRRAVSGDDGSGHMDLSGRTQTWTFLLVMGNNLISHAAHYILVCRDSITAQAR
ncbi:hypothetical protein [Paenibacillus sp. FSL K6-1318]|uniref:hypothetical protein n=1 Tax=Paenibacillus sp. FSL K6-1318 TaxID=2975291 RepID=UPI0030EF5C4C